jgi:hypothetical protein
VQTRASTLAREVIVKAQAAFLDRLAEHSH